MFIQALALVATIIGDSRVCSAAKEIATTLVQTIKKEFKPIDKRSYWTTTSAHMDVYSERITELIGLLPSEWYLNLRFATSQENEEFGPVEKGDNPEHIRDHDDDVYMYPDLLLYYTPCGDGKPFLPYPKTVKFYDLEKYIHGPLTITGTVKLHGTNAGICTDGTDIWYQNRTKVLVAPADNYDFRKFAEKRNHVWRQIFAQLTMTPGHTYCIFGEWCGQKIQKGVAIASLDRFLAVFDIIEYDIQGQIVSHPEYKPVVNDQQVYFCKAFQTWTLTISPQTRAQDIESMKNITESVGKTCPVGQFFGVTGPGEGVVWSTPDGKYKFKTLAHEPLGECPTFRSLGKFFDANITFERYLKSKEASDTLDGRVEWCVQDILTEEIQTIELSKFKLDEVKASLPKRVAKDFEFWFRN